jgi:predicted RNA-binding protein Jag
VQTEQRWNQEAEYRHQLYIAVMRNGKRVQEETKRRQQDLGVKYEQAKMQVAQDIKQGINNKKGEIKVEEVSGNIF